MGQSLWYIFKHSTVDSLRITALNVSSIYNSTREYIPQKIVMFINDSSHLWFQIANIRIILLVHVIRYKLTLSVQRVLDGGFGLIFQALCRITHHNPTVFQSVIDTVGMTTILSALSFGITKIQQSIVTMFGALIASGQSLNRVVQDKVLSIPLFTFTSFVKALIYIKCIFKP